MAEEPIKPNPSVDTAALMAEVEALRKSNREILDDYKSLRQRADMTKRLQNRHNNIVTQKRQKTKGFKN